MRDDFVPAAEAARQTGVPVRTIREWMAKDPPRLTVRAGEGRRGRLVSIAEVAALAAADPLTDLPSAEPAPPNGSSIDRASLAAGVFAQLDARYGETIEALRETIRAKDDLIAVLTAQRQKPRWRRFFTVRRE